MISTSPEYQAAIVGSPRRIEILAIVDLSDPDLSWGPVNVSGEAPWSHKEQLHDKEWDTPPPAGHPGAKPVAAGRLF